MLGVATGAGAFTGSPEPRAHNAANAVPDLTGTWEPVKSPHGTPPWQLTASNGLKNLEAHWHGGPGPHETLVGEFHGTLSATGTLYEGPYKITEAGNPNPSEGTAKFVLIEGANRIKLYIGTEEIVFSRLGAAPSPAAVTPTTMAPALGKTTLYAAPAPGVAGSNPLPNVSKKARALAGLIGFVDAEGKPVPGPGVAAIEAQDEKAHKICGVLLAAEGESSSALAEEFGSPVPYFHTCFNTVSRVLARNEELVRGRAHGARAKAAARACSVRLGGNGAAHSSLRVRCTATASGLSVELRPRSSKQKLAAALHGHAPKLIVARSAVTPGPAGLRLSELWRAK